MENTKASISQHDGARAQRRKLWERFTATGKIEDYLAYSRAGREAGRDADGNG